MELEGEEFPFFDGSGQGYLSLLKKAGIKSQDEPKKFFSCQKPVIIFEDEKFFALLPEKELKITVAFTPPRSGSFSSFALPKLNPAIYEKEIVWARTFGLYPFPRFLKKIGVSYQEKDHILYPKRRRAKDEFIRHKVLDLLGDLKILGQYLKGKIFVYNPSHKLNYKAICQIYQEEKWTLMK